MSSVGADCTARRTEVIAEIESAFRSVPHPGEAKLLHPECYSGDDSDIANFRRIGRWGNVAGNSIVSGYAALSFFSPEAFRFFIPAFMIWSLANVGKTDAFAIDSTIYSLNPNSRGKISRFALSKYVAFSEAERLCVVHFLEVMRDCAGGLADSEAANKALTDYWSKVK